MIESFPSVPFATVKTSVFVTLYSAFVTLILVLPSTEKAVLPTATETYIPLFLLFVATTSVIDVTLVSVLSVEMTTSPFVCKN